MPGDGAGDESLPDEFEIVIKQQNCKDPPLLVYAELRIQSSARGGSHTALGSPDNSRKTAQLLSIIGLRAGSTQEAFSSHKGCRFSCKENHSFAFHIGVCTIAQCTEIALYSKAKCDINVVLGVWELQKF